MCSLIAQRDRLIVCGKIQQRSISHECLPFPKSLHETILTPLVHFRIGAAIPTHNPIGTHLVCVSDQRKANAAIQHVVPQKTRTPHPKRAVTPEGGPSN